VKRHIIRHIFGSRSKSKSSKLLILIISNNLLHISDSTQDDIKSEERKNGEQGIVQGMEEKEPNPDTTGPEENLRQKAAKMNDKSQESKEPA
jgi:hypothetical protein